MQGDAYKSLHKPVINYVCRVKYTFYIEIASYKAQPLHLSEAIVDGHCVVILSSAEPS